ncbi:MAG: hypothetical protein N4A31_00315, partial [Rickettsiales bacterium]|nr:hypothetical protein [Rickettsiales bacterium]
MFKKIFSIITVLSILTFVRAQAKTYYYFAAMPWLMDSSAEGPFGDGSGESGGGEDEVLRDLYISSVTSVPMFTTDTSIEVGVSIGSDTIDDLSAVNIVASFVDGTQVILDDAQLSNIDGAWTLALTRGTTAIEVGTTDVQLTATLGEKIVTKTISVIVSESLVCDSNLLNDMEMDGDGYRLIGGSSGDSALARVHLECLSQQQDSVTLAYDYKITANIILSSSDDFTPIGTLGSAFKGVFDGDAHTISNLKMNTSGDY